MIINVTVMNECYGKNFILNGILQPADTFDNSLVYQGDSIYEVIRIVKGSPVFFNDHMDRLGASIKLQNRKPVTEILVLKKDIINLIKSDRQKEVNIKIVFNYKEYTNNYLIYFLKPVYPSAGQYKSGVKGILCYAERKDPESKVINNQLLSSVRDMLIREEGYEALLVNEEGRITEGSRSNIFFIKGKRLTTAPDETVLNGVTRKWLLEICRENNIPVEFKCIPAGSISDYDAVFMSGTSPMVLPFSYIGNTAFNVNIPLIDQLRELYIAKAEESISSFMTDI